VVVIRLDRASPIATLRGSRPLVPSASRMQLRRDRATWDALAESDPLWAICSLERGRRGGWNTAAFFATGAADVDAAFGFFGELGLNVAPGAALDFGCGVGRLTRALAGRFSEVVGVDVSSRMVDLARDLNADQENCRFVVNPRSDLESFDDHSFDLVFSLIALQHVTSRSSIRSYVREFVRVCRPGGVIAFQVPAALPLRVRLHPLRLLSRTLPARLSGRSPRLQPHTMSLTALPEPEVRGLLETAGATVVAAVSDDRVGSRAVPSLSYVATKPH
jgi:SAM-dependent methyltransferase